jgi:hypothetical protein
MLRPNRWIGPIRLVLHFFSAFSGSEFSRQFELVVVEPLESPAGYSPITVPGPVMFGLVNSPSDRFDDSSDLTKGFEVDNGYFALRKFVSIW